MIIVWRAAGIKRHMLEKQWVALMGVKCRGLPHSAADTSVTQSIFFRDPDTKRYRSRSGGNDKSPPVAPLDYLGSRASATARVPEEAVGHS